MLEYLNSEKTLILWKSMRGDVDVVLSPTCEEWDMAVSLSPMEFIAPVPYPVDLLALAADLRWRREVGGITVAGLAVATDDRSKLMLSGARIAAMADPAYATRWKTPAGWVDLDASTIIALSDAVQAHVAACFALEAHVAEQIENGEISDDAGVIAAFE